MTFTTQTMQEILSLLKDELETKERISFHILNPDLGEGYAGNEIIIDNTAYIYRGFKAWVDLAELLMCKMLLPKEGVYPLVTLTFKKLKTDSFHNDSKDSEKYGTNSRFAHINKMEEPAFLYYYQQALANVKVENKKRILNLGVNRGDEFEVIRKQLNTKKYENIEFVGIDHSQTALEYAKSLFPEDNVTFYRHDINDINSLGLGRFDLLISIGTLQSPGIHYKPFLMELVQEHLTEDAALILGFPNSRWIGGEMVYGAKAPNYAMNEMSLLLNDAIFAKKYLQQKKFRVTITGKQYLFLTATKIGSRV